MHRIASAAKTGLTQVADVIWPGRSLISGEPARSALTAEDFAALHFITGALCYRCGRPQLLDLGEAASCAACLTRPPPWDRARAALVYDDISRIPILALKRAGRRDGLKVMANWMAAAGPDILSEADLILPVPLHYRRLVQRGYNQAGWLATTLGRATSTPVSHTALIRTRATPSQAGLGPRARHANVAGAFRIQATKKPLIAGKHVILIDDVMTTGATLRAATKAVSAAGAAGVDIITLARVVHEDDIAI